MKVSITQLKVIIIVAAISATLSWSFTQPRPVEHLARPQQIQGVAVFYDATPIDPYETLATDKNNLCVNCVCTHMAQRIVEKYKEKYPDMSGVIVTGLRHNNYEIIRFTK